MLGAHRSRSLAVAALAIIGLGISNPLPAHASTLTATLGCETLVSGFMCDGYVSGGIPQYTYTWNQTVRYQSDYSDHSTIGVSCSVGQSRYVTFTVQDSSGATASRSLWVYCSGGTP